MPVRIFPAGFSYHRWILGVELQAAIGLISIP